MAGRLQPSLAGSPGQGGCGGCAFGHSSQNSCHRIGWRCPFLAESTGWVPVYEVTSQVCGGLTISASSCQPVAVLKGKLCPTKQPLQAPND